MREIKFKAWDKKNKQIAEVVAIDYLANEVMLDYFGKMYFLNFEYAELLQFTGLKDKNGTEIYEGDILQGTYYFRGVGWYDTGEGDVEIKGKVVYEQGGYECQGYNLGDLTNDVEIIGNIYESPEIME